MRIEAQKIPYVWTDIRRKLEFGLKMADEYSLNNAFDYLCMGEWQLFKKNGSIAITRIAQYPQHRSMIILICVGAMEDIKEGLPELEDFARSVGCKRIEAYGRKGWERALGWPVSEVILKKELN